MEEKILCAAIWFDNGKQYSHQPKNISSGLVLCGWRHGCIFPQIGGLVKERQEQSIYKEEQGFLTSANRFVERPEAFEIAFKQNQILPEKLERAKQVKYLYSEYIY